MNEETEINRTRYASGEVIQSWKSGKLKPPVIVPPEGMTEQEFFNTWEPELKIQYFNHLEAWNTKQKSRAKNKIRKATVKASRRKNRR